MSDRLAAILVVNGDGRVAYMVRDAFSPSFVPNGLAPEAWFAAERKAGRDWRVDRDIPFIDGAGPLGHDLYISREPHP